MATIQLQVITPERVVLEDEADIVIARGAEGDLGILHGHEPLITPLQTGELMYRIHGEERHLAISGGFLEVRPDKVVVLADVAERSEEINAQRAEEARARAEAALSANRGTAQEAEAAASLQRALLRLRVSERRRHHERPGVPVSEA
ncbi:MAG: F0F1 ATP synthase subunit epsilon [Chloroflexota bacterium]